MNLKLLSNWRTGAYGDLYDETGVSICKFESRRSCQEFIDEINSLMKFTHEEAYGEGWKEGREAEEKKWMAYD